MVDLQCCVNFCYIARRFSCTYIYMCVLFFIIFLTVLGLYSLVGASGSYCSLGCVGFSLRWPLLLRGTGSRHPGFSGCGARA